MRAMTIKEGAGIDFTHTRFNSQYGGRPDGMKLIEPSANETCKNPKPLTKSQCRKLIFRFMEKGISRHSGEMRTAWVIIEYCRNKDIRVRITRWCEGDMVLAEIKKL